MSWSKCKWCHAHISAKIYYNLDAIASQKSSERIKRRERFYSSLFCEKFSWSKNIIFQWKQASKPVRHWEREKGRKRRNWRRRRRMKIMQFRREGGTKLQSWFCGKDMSLEFMERKMCVRVIHNLIMVCSSYNFRKVFFYPKNKFDNAEKSIRTLQLNFTLKAIIIQFYWTTVGREIFSLVYLM